MFVDSWGIYTVIGAISAGAAFLLGAAILTISQWNANQSSKLSIAYIYIVKVCGISFILTKHILFQPFCTILFSVLRCSFLNDQREVVHPGYDCKDQTHIILFCFSLFILVLLFLLGLVMVWLFSDDQPDSRLPWAYCRRVFDVCRFVQKPVLPLAAFVATSSQSVLAAEILALVALSAVCLHQLYGQVYMNNRIVYYTLLVSELVALWMNTIVLLNILLDIDWSHPIILGIFAVMSFVAVFLVGEKRLKVTLKKSEIKRLKEMKDVETYSRILMDEISKENIESKSFIEEFLMIHSIECKDSLCVCRKFEGKTMNSNDEVNADDLSEPKKGSNLKDASSTCIENYEVSKKRRRVYEVVIGDIASWGESLGRTARFHIYLASLKLLCYDNPLAALHELMCARDASPSLYDSFMIFRLT